MNAKTALTEFKTRFDPLLGQYFDDFVSKKSDVTEEILDVVHVLQEFTTRGGKRVRAALAYYSYILCGGEDREEMLKACIPIEILGAYILLEDDFMDRAEKRRGGRTVHKDFEEYHKSHYTRGDPELFATAMTLTGGILMGQMVTDSFLSTSFPKERKEEALARVTEILMYTGFGQFMDIVSEVKEKFTEVEAITVPKWKTATYTFRVPLRLGAILAGADVCQLNDLDGFGTSAGVAFQLQDDILDLFGDEEKLGKPVGTDISEGKMTLLMVKALDECSPAQKNRINKLLGQGRVDENDIKEMQNIVKSTGAYDYVCELAKKYVKEAQTALSNMSTWNEEGYEFLHNIAEYMIQRDV